MRETMRETNERYQMKTLTPLHCVRPLSSFSNLRHDNTGAVQNLVYTSALPTVLGQYS